MDRIAFPAPTAAGRGGRGWRLAACGLAVALTGACSGGGDDGGGGAAPEDPVAARGLALVEENGCLACHTTDGSKSTGPTWKDLAGSQVRLIDGRQVVADREYLRRSVLEPDADTVAEFPAQVMAAAIPPGTVTPEEADAIVSYIESLGKRPRKGP